MRARFWPDRAWKSLVGRAWPWVAPGDGPDYRERVTSTLRTYWGEQRLPRVPGDFLSEATRKKLGAAADAADADTVFWGVYEKIAAAAAGDGRAFWFFDLGAAGWMLMLRRLRQGGWLPERADLSQLVEIEQVWRNGPGHAAAEIDARLEAASGPTPGLRLYRVPDRKSVV